MLVMQYSSSTCIAFILLTNVLLRSLCEMINVFFLLKNTYTNTKIKIKITHLEN